MSKEEKKELYSCDFDLKKEDYVNMCKLVPLKNLLYFSIKSGIAALICALLSLAFFNVLAFFITLVVVFLVTLGLFYLTFEYQCEKIFESLTKINGSKCNYIFYKEYFISKKNSGDIKYYYSDYVGGIETDDYFCIFLNKKKGRRNLCIPKRHIDLKLIDFIRKTFNNIDNRIGEKGGVKKFSKLHDPKVMKNVLLILFWASIASLFVSMEIKSLIVDYYNLDFYGSMKLWWIAVIFMPIIVVSFILGVRYRSMGFKCTKNIIGGIFIFFQLIIVALAPEVALNHSYEYEKVFKYEEIIGVKLPKDGNVINYDSSMRCPNGTTKCSLSTVTFSEKDGIVFFDTLKSNSNWFSGDKVSDDRLLDLLPSTQNSKSNYYLIYNVTTEEYNIFPKNSGTYSFYVFENISEDFYDLNIYNFEYEIK